MDWALKLMAGIYAAFMGLMFDDLNADRVRDSASGERFCRDCRWYLTDNSWFAGLFGFRTGMNGAHCMHPEAVMTGADVIRPP